MGDVTVEAATATSQPSSKPASSPIKKTDKPTGKPVSAPTADDDYVPVIPTDPSELGKLVVVHQEVVGISKRAGGWKDKLETALKPIIADAIGVQAGRLSFVDVSRRYETNSIWVEFTFRNTCFEIDEKGMKQPLPDCEVLPNGKQQPLPNCCAQYKEHDVKSAVESSAIVKKMDKALQNAGLGKGNDPAVGSVTCDIVHETMQPTTMPVKSPKSDDDDDDDKKVKTTKPTSKPSKKPTTKKPTSKPIKSTDEPTLEPTDSPEDSTGKTILVVQEVTGITKRAGGWKTAMEEALLPVIAKALDVKRSDVTYVVRNDTNPGLILYTLHLTSFFTHSYTNNNQH